MPMVQNINPSWRAPQGRGHPEIEPLDRHVASLLAMTILEVRISQLLLPLD